ncbi:serine/threonine-protein phosphatase [Nocardioides sp. zg-536]|uniref:Serine/threonine-protein phosphatase n=1 Tax=Nocardioides faecalis TaxID=2803858 RepID=A0A938YBG1_9ACTN|nr:PP2C family protein-serine/threonine phosphatase [Nocardioides faecalis]MBM9461573.1 serine/threonine-protein phosphatase [Nocardioides faecalis]MBS4752517.1 serine/threonine-protein phosphatase [Nocardioides faecalis]QVI57793.1 serine/threonine-protein phosphatase [Nocardioides faecalis]
MPTTTSSPLRSFLRASPRGDFGLAVGLFVLALLLVADLATGVILTASYASAVIVCSLITTPRRTALLAVLTVGLSLVSGLWHGTFGTRDWVVRGTLSGLLCAMAVVASAVTAAREQRLRTMTRIAEVAQRAVLRATPARLGTVALASRYQSATADAMVGGDLYEAVSTPYGIRILIGDVRGKGIEAVETAATVLGAFRQSASTVPDLARLCANLDEAVSLVVEIEDFVTAVVVEISGTRMRVASCGHHPPLLVHGSSASEVETGDPSPPLGLGAWPQVTAHVFPVGARLLLYTDGVVEARDRDGEFFDLLGVAGQLGADTPDGALDDLLGALRAHSKGRLGDDLAMVLVENLAGEESLASRPVRDSVAHLSA